MALDVQRLDVSAGLRAYPAHGLNDMSRMPGDRSLRTGFDVVSVAQRDFLDRIAQLALQGSDARCAVGGIGSEIAPELHGPIDAEVVCIGLTKDDARLAKLASTLTSIIGAADLQTLKAYSEASAQSIRNSYERLVCLSDAFRLAIDDAKAAAGAAGGALRVVNQRFVGVADDAVSSAQSAYVDAISEGLCSDGCVDAKDATEGAAQCAINVSATANLAVADATQQLSTAIALAMDALDCEGRLNDAMQQGNSRSGLAVRGQSHFDGAAELTLLLGEIQDMISSNNVSELESKRQLLFGIQARREVEALKQAEEYDQQLKKANEIQKVMGVVGKIIGWFITGVGVVAAAFTGGASLVVASIGLALALGDEVVRATTGVSVMGRIMQPVVEKVVDPLVKAVSSEIANLLIDLGVDAGKATLAGAILGGFIAGVVLSLGAIVGASIVRVAATGLVEAIGSQLTKLMDSSIGRVLSEQVAERLETLSESAGVKSIASRLDAVLARMSRAVGFETREEGLLFANRLTRAALVLRVVNQVSQSTSSGIVGVESDGSMELHADVREAKYEVDQIAGLLRQAVDLFADRNRVLARLMQEMSDATNAQMSAGTLVLRNVRAV